MSKRRSPFDSILSGALAHRALLGCPRRAPPHRVRARRPSPGLCLSVVLFPGLSTWIPVHSGHSRGSGSATPALGVGGLPGGGVSTARRSPRAVPWVPGLRCPLPGTSWFPNDALTERGRLSSSGVPSVSSVYCAYSRCTRA